VKVGGRDMVAAKYKHGVKRIEEINNYIFKVYSILLF